MTAPNAKKSLFLMPQLNFSDYARRGIQETLSSAALSLEFSRPGGQLAGSLHFQFFRPDSLPRFGNCGILRNNSVFGCDYLNAAGQETKLGMNLETYVGGFGVSLKIFLGGR